MDGVGKLTELRGEPVEEGGRWEGFELQRVQGAAPTDLAAVYVRPAGRELPQLLLHRDELGMEFDRAAEFFLLVSVQRGIHGDQLVFAGGELRTQEYHQPGGWDRTGVQDSDECHRLLEALPLVPAELHRVEVLGTEKGSTAEAESPLDEEDHRILHEGIDPRGKSPSAPSVPDPVQLNILDI